MDIVQDLKNKLATAQVLIEQIEKVEQSIAIVENRDDAPPIICVEIAVGEFRKIASADALGITRAHIAEVLRLEVAKARAQLEELV